MEEERPVLRGYQVRGDQGLHCYVELHRKLVEEELLFLLEARELPLGNIELEEVLVGIVELSYLHDKV